jgi:DEAD/DEAH box helicase domain-containing protein
VSVVGLYDYAADRYLCVREEGLGELRGLLAGAEQVVGFNLLGFDYPVLAAEVGEWVHDLPTLDLMAEAQRSLGHRVSLESLARATLGGGKLGSGLDALAYYRAGDWEKLERYCLEDVKLTKALYEYALREGTLYFMKGARRAPVPLSFAKSPFHDAFAAAAKSQGSVRMRYGGKERLADVRSFDGRYIRAFCHLRGEEVTFRLDRVEDAVPAPSSTPLFS